jgi:hypothetical protein
MGDQYGLNNKRVYGIKKHLTLRGLAWAYVNFVVMLQMVKEHGLRFATTMKGEAYKQKEEASMALELVYYKGECLMFTLEHFLWIL